MFRAFSFPVALFLVFPLAVVLLFGSREAADVAEALGSVVALLAALYLTGFVLAPWAGSRLPGNKGPAFVLAVLAALAPAATIAIAGSLSASIALSLGVAAVFALLAVPASLLGALLFIGGCERLHPSKSASA
ncbi:hypothetical protein [Lysobacter sp. HA35]